jgi:hypothetical protein
VLRHIRDVRRAIRPREREIDARAAARYGNSEAETVIGLAHLFLPGLERQDAMPISQSHRKFLTEETRCTNLGADAPIPAVDSLDLRFRQSVE